MTRILCTVDTETGEVLRADGSVAGKVVPKEIPLMTCGDISDGYENLAASNVMDIYDAMLAASKVDLTGCEVKVPPLKYPTMQRWGNVEDWAHNAVVKAILDQMPKGK